MRRPWVTLEGTDGDISTLVEHLEEEQAHAEDPPGTTDDVEPTVRKITLGLSRDRMQSDTPTLSVPGRLEGRQCRVICDTGAAVTVVSKELWLKLGRGMGETSQKQQLVYADGSPESATYVEGVKIQLGKHEFVWNVYVAGIADEILLGADFLTEHAAVIDLQQLRITLTPQGKGVAEVKLRRKTSFQPKHITRITCELHPPVAEVEQLEFNPFPLKTESGQTLIAASSIAKGGKVMQIMVVNDSDQMITVGKGETMGVTAAFEGTILEEDPTAEGNPGDAGTPPDE